MIFLRSSLTGVAELPSLNQKSAAGKPSPGGEGRGEGELNPREQSERHFLYCSLVGELLYRGRQSGLIWLSTPAGGIRVNSCNSRMNLCGKSPKLQNEPNFLCKLLSIKKIRVAAISPSRLFKPIQSWHPPRRDIVQNTASPRCRPGYAYYRLFSGKKRLFIFMSHTANPNPCWNLRLGLRPPDLTTHLPPPLSGYVKHSSPHPGIARGFVPLCGVFICPCRCRRQINDDSQINSNTNQIPAKTGQKIMCALFELASNPLVKQCRFNYY
jgi:hypothetical protein